MDDMTAIPNDDTWSGALSAQDPSVRLQAALTIGIARDEHTLGLMIERCAVEPDFYVRDMLTWAIIQLPRVVTVPALQAELTSTGSQGRSQALHTLSKIGVPEAWGWVFPDLVRDPDDEVARAAWRVAVGVLPPGQEGALTAVLVSQFGRGDLKMKKSLARALGVVALRHEAVLDAVDAVAHRASREVRAQAHATLTVLRDPGASFAGALAGAEPTCGASRP